jgi:putative Mn2+ efflux pump MntP
MSWGYRRRSGWLGAAILIAVGVIGLLANFNIVSAEMLRQFWKLWPIIPLAIGVSILFGRNRYRIDHPGDPGHD